jgi:hypothetical protein
MPPEEHWNEHGNEQASPIEQLLWTIERRLQPRLAHLHVARDVLQHDDRVVDDESDAQRGAISDRLSRL